MTTIERVLPKVTQEETRIIEEAIKLACEHLQSRGMGPGKAGVAFKVGLVSMALQAAGFEPGVNDRSGELTRAIGATIDEKIAKFRDERDELA